MKVLYVGHFTEGSGWSNSATNNVLALKQANVNVVCRNLQLTPNQNPVHPQISEAMQNDTGDVDVCVQHVLPHFLTQSSIFKKTIGFFNAGETDTIKFSPWYDNIKNMQEMWVPCETVKKNLENDGISNVHTIPHTFDLQQYKDKQDVNLSVGTLGAFKFYFIGEFSDRKNIEAIIKCFHSEFVNNESVELVLKLNKFGVPPETLHNMVRSTCDNIKNTLRIYPRLDDYRKEIIISNRLSEEEMKNLHMSCDCFVSPSHGESFSIPSFEAMAYGNTPICSEEGGPADFIDKNNKDTGTLVSGVRGICTDRTSAFPFVNTGRETWFIPDELEIRKAMRFYYENRINNEEGIKRAENNSYSNVSKLMIERINNV